MPGQGLCASFSKVLLLAIIAMPLVACGGDSGSAATATNSAVADAVVVSGSVGDGPVTGATVEVWSSSGSLIKTMESDNTASFTSRFRVRRSSYPLLLKVRGGIDLVTGDEPDFQMESVKLDRNAQAVNINPFSTLIVKIAQFLPGGINADNIDTARAIVLGKLGFGLDPGAIPDPISSEITDANIANLTKSSEAMGEMIRRTRDRIAGTGRKTSGDAILAAIAADLQDGALDGRGADGADPRITAVAQVVSGQVLVEALANTLKVGGIISTAVMDQAIKTTRPGVGSEEMTRSVRVTAGMLQQTHKALAAASVLDSSAEVSGLDTIVSDIEIGALPDAVANVLPADSSRSLDNAVLLASTADITRIAVVNMAGQAGTTDSGATAPEMTATVDTAPVNQAPAISGSPVRSVEVGSAYNFQPVASDADGDTLTFSITGKPAWAGFDASSGRLSGTPGDADAGTYSNIVIAVTDGADTAALPGFSVVVEPAPSAAGSFALAWAAPIARADGSPLSLADIGGYRIYYGTSAGSYPDTVDVGDGSASSATVSNLPAGTYYVVMTSYDNNGLESGYSPELVKIAH